ncbi:MAG: DUF1501 domain-containing protein [Gemmataceae bacterium]|nr:DUF1501 domain-containing protein [Gemmataceae bacterium]
MNRRHFLKHVMGTSALAIPGLEFLRTINANAQELRRQNKSVIIMWMGGGPATIDIWDLKPGASTGGEFRPIETSAPGVRISEHMPNTARQMDKLAIIRSLTTTEGDHMRGTQLMHTSYTPNPAIQFPSIGAVAAQQIPRLGGYREISLPNYITVGGGGATGPGFLGMVHAPFTIQNPGTPPQNIRPPQSVAANADEMTARIQRRRRLWNLEEDAFLTSRAPHLNESTRNRFADASKAHNDVYQRAFSLVASSEGQVFNLASESQNLMTEYGAAGTGANNFGRAAVMARRLVEAGVSAVEISLGGWDTHNQTFNAHRTTLQPNLDRAMGALVRDLNDRGLWRNTVLLWMGEFGRTPRINQNTGRDHWARNWSVVVGGGAIRGGQAYGTTNSDGTDVATNPVRVGDVFATVYRALGIDPGTQVRDAIGRPFAIAGGNGRPIEQLF